MKEKKYQIKKKSNQNNVDSKLKKIVKPEVGTGAKIK